MAVGAMNLYDAAIENIFTAGIGSLESETIVAVLLGSGYTVDLDTHSTYANISAHENADSDYAPFVLTTPSVEQVTGGGIKFDTDDIDLGDPVTIEDVKYLAFVVRAGVSLASTDKLLGVSDLRTEGGTIGSVESGFSITAPANGWFTVNRA